MASRADFFQVGGALSEDSPSYVERPADEALLAALERGELCLVLAPRQTGKSSLMVHARVQLKTLGVVSGIVDFQPPLLAPFQEVLGPDSAPLVERIFYWTAGQPLMVQKLTEGEYACPAAERTAAQVDQMVEGTYLKGNIETDTHLKFIRDYVLEDNKKLRQTLKTYQAVLEGKAVPYDDQSPVHSRLKLAGVVRTHDRKLASRNRIYEQVFDLAWVKDNAPRDVTKLVAYGASVALVLVLAWFFLLQPVFFPKFTKFQTSSWLDEEVFYVEESAVRLELPVPDAEIARIELDGRALPWKGGEAGSKGNRIEIRLDGLPVGTSEYRLRFYGGLWKENFETRFLVVAYPRAHRQPLTDLEMIAVAGGCFLMGCRDWDGECESDEKPVREVCLDSFQVGKYEVTQDQWQRLMGYNPSWFKRGGQYPVEKVSWNDVQEFIRRLNQLTGERFRLHTEAEWEFAARSGGRPEKYAGGNDLKALAWYRSNSRTASQPVGQKAPNSLGLHDMSGNVWEWVQDWYDRDYYQSRTDRNPQGPETGAYRVVRGGSWRDDAQHCRAAVRDFYPPVYRGDFLGFRLARSVTLGP
jgi:formylglycine-generating enzyme required for sulfatase activity